MKTICKSGPGPLRGGQTFSPAGIEVEGAANGSVEFDNVALTNGCSGAPGMKDDGTAMTVDQGSGNTGW